MGRSVTVQLAALALAPAVFGAAAEPELSQAVFVVPNFHPASCGWLTDFSHERVYCANSYLDHLDRVAADGAYAFVISEVNTMIAIRNFAPARFDELRQRLAGGRVEAVNAFFLEPTICLSGGEALVKQGVEGLRWQEQVLGVRPRHCWMIDVTGMHEQMFQIAAGLGLDTFVHCRMNNSGSTLYWGQSPDGTRILTVSPGHYNEWPALFRATEALDAAALQALIDDARSRERKTSLADVPTMRTPDGAPTLVLAGSGDYSLAPLYAPYPAAFLDQWNAKAPDLPLRFSTFGDYVDAVKPGTASGALALPTVTGGWNFSYYGFWIQNPMVKQRYRRAEHALQASEMLATLASLRHETAYPAQDLYHAWLLMLLNMDRNTLWGGAGGMVFEHPDSWDVKDRFDWVDAACARICGESIGTIRGDGGAVTLFNPANWRRTDPVVLPPDCASGLGETPCQTLPSGEILCLPDLPATGWVSFGPGNAPPSPSTPVALPEAIETAFYTARIDAETGNLASLKLKPSGRELLAAPANVLVAESPTSGKGSSYFGGNDMDFRPKRERRAASSDFPCRVAACEGPLATVVEVTGEFYGGKAARRVMTFYRDHPRIDFDTYLEDIPDRTVVVAEFPLAPKIAMARRGIPYGFSQGAWPAPAGPMDGCMKGITPAVRWSHYAFEDGGGAALLDRGLPGREIDGNTPLLFLLNAVETYMGFPCAWLSGNGAHHLQYALIAHDEDWQDARIARAGWAYNGPPVAAKGTAGGNAESLLQTSDNVIVEAVRREEGHIEVRLVECLGVAGEAVLAVHLPHESAALTDLTGQRPSPLPGGPEYRFGIRPQQIVTVRLATGASVGTVTPLTDWTPLVPEHKRLALRAYDPAVKGHPPHG